ncbi:unnamed protein product [Peniophora sp. CBMAI 1063]|nr:unnamed protein product [Peniophora sp. CBMAI 1063]
MPLAPRQCSVLSVERYRLRAGCWHLEASRQHTGTQALQISYSFLPQPVQRCGAWTRSLEELDIRTCPTIAGKRRTHAVAILVDTGEILSANLGTIYTAKNAA